MADWTKMFQQLPVERSQVFIDFIPQNDECQTSN